MESINDITESKNKSQRKKKKMSMATKRIRGFDTSDLAGGAVSLRVYAVVAE